MGLTVQSILDEYLPFHFNDQIPIDIDTHPIPENKAKGEAGHWHHDFRYLFLCDDPNQAVVIDGNESGQYQWVTINELQQMQTFVQVTNKIQERLDA